MIFLCAATHKIRHAQWSQELTPEAQTPGRLRQALRGRTRRENVDVDRGFG